MHRKYVDSLIDINEEKPIPSPCIHANNAYPQCFIPFLCTQSNNAYPQIFDSKRSITTNTPSQRFPPLLLLWIYLREAKTLVQDK
jgi:hypothetical protein